jgi:hypothetical protein
VAREYAVWWLALSAVYFLLITSPTGLEVPVGLAIGAAAAAVAVVARRAFRPSTSVPSFVRRMVLLPLDIGFDAVEMTRLLVSGRAFLSDCGTLDHVDLPDDDATRVWAVLLTSAAPGSLAADVGEDGGRLVLRRHLLTRSGRATAAVGRR